jgi:hypothetical protein
VYVGPTADPLPEITDVNRLVLRPGDSLIVHLDRRPSEAEAHEIQDRVRAVLGMPELPVIILGPGEDIEVIGPDGDACPA